MTHEKFHYNTLEQLQKRAAEIGATLPFARDTRILGTPLTVGNITLPNRLGIAPMEGADAQADGSPSEYTIRRYLRDAEGGSAVIWFEAISIVPEALSSRTQLLITRKNLDSYKRLVSAVKEAGIRVNGYAPYLVMQANHSGRYSNPNNKPQPLIAYRHPELEQYRAADDSCIVTDDYLKGLEDQFAVAAQLAQEAGFDAIDIKSCHGYLLMELLSAYHRPGEYGGCYENRTRMLKNSICAAQSQASSNFMVTARIGIYDGFPYPYGFGVSPDSGLNADFTEPIRLVRELHQEFHLPMVNLTMGNPYATTHITRPYDRGKYVPEEHPLLGVSRMIQGIGTVKQAVPEMTIWASAPTYLRQYADLYAAAAVEQGLCDGMLFGRMAFADPGFANQILKTGRIDPQQVCLTCGMCGDLIRSHKPTGCVVRDSETFRPFYREFLDSRKDLPANFRG